MAYPTLRINKMNIEYITTLFVQHPEFEERKQIGLNG